MNKPSMAVLGAGSWGTALAIHLANNGVETHLWGWKEEEMRRMQSERRNEAYLPGFSFPERLTVSWDLETCVKQTSSQLIVVPSHAFVSLLEQLKPMLKPSQPIAWASKGLVPDTGNLLSTAADEILGAERPKAVLSGPTFAKEVAAGMPSACAVASNDENFLDTMVEQFHSPTFRVYRTDDLIGVQLGGAVKNIIAVGAGMAEGVGFGANARAALITRGLAELVRLGAAMDARQETLYGLAGLGDLVLTATDNQSRNRRFGLALGQGQDMQQAITSIGQVVEAVRNTREVRQLARRLGVEMPIVEAIYRVLYEQMSPLEAAELLLARDIKAEGE